MLIKYDTREVVVLFLDIKFKIMVILLPSYLSTKLGSCTENNVALLATIYLQGLCTGTGCADLSWLPAEDPAVESTSAPAAWSSSSVWHTPNHSTTVSIKTIGFVNICYTNTYIHWDITHLKATRIHGNTCIFTIIISLYPLGCYPLPTCVPQFFFQLNCVRISTLNLLAVTIKHSFHSTILLT